MPVTLCLFSVIVFFYADYLHKAYYMTSQSAPSPSNTANSTPGAQKMVYKYWNIWGAGLFFGIATYAFESVGTIINVRKMAKDKTSTSRLVAISFGCIGLLYMSFSSLGYFVHGDVDQKDSVFMYYTHKNSGIFSNCQMVAVVVGFFNVIFSCLVLSENFGNWSILSNSSPSEQKWIIFLLRITFLTTSLMLGSLFEKFTTLIDISGSLFSSILNFILPVS